jgi:hypothetical protein
MKKRNPNLLFILVVLLALGCKAVFIFAPHKQKTVDVKVNTKDSTSTKKDSTSVKKDTIHTQIIIEQ